MEKDPFKEYLRESEPDKAYKGYAWSTAIQDLITLISGKASCIVKERFIRAISDTRENNGQLRGVVISFRCMRGSFVIEHLQLDFFLELF